MPFLLGQCTGKLQWTRGMKAAHAPAPVPAGDALPQVSGASGFY